MNEELNKIVRFMKQAYCRDISIYAESFLLKALERRYTTTGVNNAAEYCIYLEKNNMEVDVFYNSLHITYSKFFRDSLTFALMEQSILPNLISQKSDGDQIRIWSAGCSNGQEVYSMAILLSDLVEISGKKINLRIFATDISEEALATGRAGVYDQTEVQDVKLKHLNKYFTKQEKTYTIVPQLRQCIDFSVHDLLDLSTVNPPKSIYGDFDIVMCSNLLIYYKFDLQLFIIKKLQQAMSTIGYLVTGESEKTLVENASKLQMMGTPTAVFKNNRRREVL